MQTSVSQETKDCIRKVVEGWVYIHPRKERWYNQHFDGVTNRVKDERNLGREPFERYGRTVHFKKDGTVEQL